MAISNEHKARYIFHFTDIHNLDSIIKNGLLCTNVKDKKNITHKNIANSTIQERRAKMNVTAGLGGKVHDYVPFYFSSINPMLLKLINQKNVDQNLIVYLCAKIQRLEKEDAVFSDASANTIEPPTFYDDTSYLDKLDWNLIESRKWGPWTDDERHKKMAEALIYEKLDISEIDAIVVYNECAEKKVKKIFDDNNVTPPAILYDFDPKIKKYGFYYTKFFLKKRERESLVIGPLTLLRVYKNLLKEIKKKRQEKKGTYRFSSIQDLLQALDKDISVIPELKNVVGLRQNYSPHYDNVDDHTKKVVTEMNKLDYYKHAPNEKKNVLLLAAYLHDIGKGPIDKWDGGILNNAYLDHPADAIPMIYRILTEEIEALSDEDVRMICMLVVYHDIIGDCMKKDRDKQQIAALIESEDDIEMLFAIAYADTKAIKSTWFCDIYGKKKSFISQIMKIKEM